MSSCCLKALLLGLLSSNVSAAIWPTLNQWDLDWESRYSNWMNSSAVREKIFTDKNSPYYGINTDCADTAYAFRAIFAYENNLPFAITNPSGSRGVSKTLNNSTSKFDYIKDGNKRVVALINEIGSSVGTENLTRYDTFPPSIKSVAAGSLFTYKINARFGNTIRHAYNIKGINPVGTFDVIYSTQANQKKHGDLLRRKEIEFVNKPSDPWGFRKFRWPEHIGKTLAGLPAELNASNEQFALADQLGTSAFFKYVKKTVASRQESVTQKMERLMDGVCNETNARIGYVNDALEYLKKTGNRCMNYQDFDAFSTPARDAAIHEQFVQLNEAVNEAKSEGETNTRTYDLANFIFNGVGDFSGDLLVKCPINYRAGVTIDLREYWLRSKGKKLSSHPNDNVQARWGESTSSRTRCKTWY